ncbi:MAG TPA: sugar phosphate isomerase/epimerase family protein [Planctomycetota bacterium]|nr:sugar phosphate isomerase/epimerase family protein [Planctomycetota bacterium]
MATAYATTHNLKLGFSTWVCPQWTCAAIVDGMQQYGFDGVELRIGKGHLHGVELDSPPDYLNDVRKQFDAANVAISCIATSFAFSSPDITERQKTINQVKQCLRMADSLGAPYIRVFGGEMPPGLESTGVIDYIAEALDECTEYAEKEKMRSMILLETQGPFSHSKYVNEIMSQVFSKKLGVLWDVVHPMRVLEPVEDTYDQICDYVKHVHVRDRAFNEDRTRLVDCEPGEGFIPLPKVVDLLKSGNFRGYLSLEIVQDGIDPDEILPQYGKFLKELVKPMARV